MKVWIVENLFSSLQEWVPVVACCFDNEARAKYYLKRTGLSDDPNYRISCYERVQP